MASPDSPQSGYRALLDRLFAARRFGVELGLDRIAAVLGDLGDPHQTIARRLAIAGTNGKGSTAAFLESIALAAKVRTGLFTSPHLSRFAERFRIDGAIATGETIAAAAPAAAEHLTFFEQCTVIAAVLFAEAGVDLGIFEVGLGGRLDSTTALDADLVILTGVSYDHCDVLGHDLASIAAEKAGAVRPGAIAVIGLGGEPQSQALLAAAISPEARLIRVTPGDRDRLPAELGIAGAHQRDNAAGAAIAARELGFAGDAIAAGLRAARLPGRLEIIAGDPELIFDGAHNPDGTRALAAALRAMAPARTTAVIAVAADKDVVALLAPLDGVFERAVATRFANDRSLAADALAAQISLDLPIVTAPTIAAAIELASRSAERVVVFGSLYAVGEARGGEVDPVALSDPSGRGGEPRRVQGTTDPSGRGGEPRRVQATTDPSGRGSPKR